MGYSGAVKALYVIVNAGFADEIIDIMRAAGAGGATILNARGEGNTHKSFLGITLDSEREIILSLVDEAVGEKILSEIKHKMGLKSPANSVCFVMPVEKVIGLSQSTLQI